MVAGTAQAIEMLTGQYAPKGLAYDLWLPQNAHTFVVYAHGGGFIHGQRQDRIARNYGPFLAQQGIAFATIDYRRGGAPRRLFDPKMQEKIAKAAQRSASFYPTVRPDLLGPALYRASCDFADAHRDIEKTHVQLATVPWIAMGNSSGALAAMGATFGLQGLETATVDRLPDKVIGIAAIPPQPWMLTAADPPLRILVARGDQVFQRQEVNRCEDLAKQEDLPVEIERIPFGQHTRPIREVIPDEAGVWGAYAAWVHRQVGAGPVDPVDQIQSNPN